MIEEPASEQLLRPGRPGLVLPEQRDFVEPIGAMRMQAEFYEALRPFDPARQSVGRRSEPKISKK